MKFINRAYLLLTSLTLILFSPISNAIIISSYTAFFEDGSRVVVDLKGYDYGEGAYHALPLDFYGGTTPAEGFDAFLYASVPLQEAGLGSIGSEQIGSDSYEGLHFEVDEYNDVTMTSFFYAYWGLSSSISDKGIHLYEDIYFTEFSGGLFKTYDPPSQVDETGILALLIVGVAGLGLARQRRKANLIGTHLQEFGNYKNLYI